jgi:hypothetical protein
MSNLFSFHLFVVCFGDVKNGDDDRTENDSDGDECWNGDGDELTANDGYGDFCDGDERRLCSRFVWTEK